MLEGVESRQETKKVTLINGPGDDGAMSAISNSRFSEKIRDIGGGLVFRILIQNSG